jgi:hypothetical protein
MFVTLSLSFTTTVQHDLIEDSMAQLPDLKIMSIVVEPSSPCEGALNKVKVTFLNVGLAPAKAGVVVSLRIDPLGSSYTEKVPTKILPNNFKTVTFKRIKCRMGDNRITAIVNPEKKVQETVYKNNGKTISVKAIVNCDAVLLEN